jgi:hypothetical protein
LRSLLSISLSGAGGTNRQAAKVARGDGGRREHDLAESTTKLRNVESHEEPERVPSCLEVRDDLGDMNWGELLDGLELDDKGLVDEEVEPCLPHRSILIGKADRNLPYKRHAAELEFDGQCLLVDRLEKSWPENAVHLQCSVDDDSSE